MVKPPSSKSFNNALKILNVTVAGGTTVLLSTLTSCYLAVLVEKTAHRVQYHFFPHWYKDVDFALGLDLKSQRDSRKNNHERMNEMESREERVNKYIIGQNHYHSELNKFWSNTKNNEDDFHENYDQTINEKRSDSFDNEQYGIEKFEPVIASLTTTKNVTRESSIQGEEESATTTSNISSLLGLGSSNSGENISAALHSCAMTS